MDHILGVIWGSNAPKSEGRQIHGMEPMLGDDLFCNTTFQKFAIGASAGGAVFTYNWFQMWYRVQKEINKLPDRTVDNKDHDLIPAVIKNCKVSVVLPVKGVHKDTVNNWRSQVTSSHGGPIEYIFAMESEQDPAYAAALKFREERGGKEDIKVIACGLAFYCSQKIHNLLEGVSMIASDSDFVLFLDDDASMPPDALKVLIRTLHEQPNVMVASGWPHDYLPPDEKDCMAHFLLKGYRLLSYMSIATDDSVGVWGGCTLVRRKDLMDSTVGILEAWQDRGYSDDMIIGGRCRKMGKKIFVPIAAMLPARMDPDYNFKRHVNFSRRQMFVCSTYSDVFDLMQNYFLLVVASFFGTIFGCFNFCALSVLGSLLLLHRLLHFQLLARLALAMPCGHFSLSPETLLLPVLLLCSVFVLFMNLSYDSIGAVCERMAGEKGAYTPRQSRAYIVGMTFLGLAAQCLTLSSCAALALFTTSINWSGVVYVKAGGKVAEVWRQDAPDKPRYTRPWREAMQEAMEARKAKLSHTRS